MEHNKLIAEFMGIMVFSGVNRHTGKQYYYYNNSETECMEALPDYNNDWNSLMLVVEKIESLKLGDVDPYNDDDVHLNCVPGIEIQGKCCNLFLQADMRLIDNFITNQNNSKIEATYVVVCEFIKWYNRTIN